MTGTKPDERIRTPMRWDTTAESAGFTAGRPWQPLGDDPPGTDVETQRADPASLLSTYRQLTALRAAHPALAHGDLIPVRSERASIAAFLRQVPDETILVVANVAAEPTAATLDVEAGPLCGVTTVDVLHGPAAIALPAMRLGPREVVVLRLDR